ncbi:MAG: hypothetical protein ACJASI_002392 [Glaciecola sp.]
METKKTFEQASNDLDGAVIIHDFAVLYIHDLGMNLRDKGIEFTQECKIFEVYNTTEVAKVLAIDMRLNMTLPCRN